MSIEAMKQALEAWQTSVYGSERHHKAMLFAMTKRNEVFCRFLVGQAIEQAEKNDLERLRDENERLHIENRRLIDRIEVMGVPVGVGGYLTTTATPQPQREWAGLTDGEIESLAKWADKHGYGSWHIEFARAIEDELKEKNSAT